MPGMTPDPIESVRAFNRFYTRRIGVLHEGLLDTPFTLTESRLLWEFAHHESAHHDSPTATQLARALDLDAGYLSRLLRSFKERGLIKSTRSSADARHVQLSLTAAGRKAFAPLDTRSRDQVAGLLNALPPNNQQKLLAAMGTIQRLLDDDKSKPHTAPYLLRPHRPGDMGWIVSRHGALYAQEHRYDMRFEAMVARIAADFIERFDATREACWMAERDGANVGSVAIVQARDEVSHAPLPGTAQLRLLLVEPSARGLGIGKRLVDECERFARLAGYERITLWTNSQLDAARGIYQKAGYTCVASEAHHSFGHDLVGETWQKELRA
jgi:DNA-binding MarR family transcriptional regulator/GNAT superfamily N-acetyltransferase